MTTPNAKNDQTAVSASNSTALLSFEDRCRQWLEKQPNWEVKVELGKLLMIPLMDLTSAQLARLSELREVLGDNVIGMASPSETPL